MVYVNSHVDDVIFAEELRELAARHANFTLSEVISRPPAGYAGHSGRLTLETLRALLGEVGERMFYICGPTPFNDSCVALLGELGVARRRIRVEANGAPKTPHEQAGWPAGVALEDEVQVTVRGRGSFRSQVGEPAQCPGAQRLLRGERLPLGRVQPVPGQAGGRQRVQPAGGAPAPVRP